MVSSSGRYTILYRGRLYNFKSLRGTLQDEGVKFKGHSDIELIVEGFDRDRVDIFERLNGSFALAIYDSYANLLYIARRIDLGIEPL